MSLKENRESGELSLGMLMGETFKILGRRISVELSAHDLNVTIEQYLLLLAINHLDEATQNELSKIFQKDKSAILRHTDELEKKKMVVRVVDREGRRKKTLVITKKGAESLQRIKEVEAGIIEKMLVGVSVDDLDAFHRVLQVINRNARL